MDPIETRRIDQLDPFETVSNFHQLTATFDGGSGLLSVLQVSAQVELNLAGVLGGKAPLASPAFTGNPTAPTPAAGDDDTTIPNTGWVQDEIASAIAINPLSAKTSPVDADLIRIADSAASFVGKKLTFANLWAWISGKVLTLFNVAGSAPPYAARAWANFNGTLPVTVRASGNVMAVGRNGTGDYTMDFISAMPHANYVVSGAGRLDNSTPDARVPDIGIKRGVTPTMTSVRLQATEGTTAAADCDYVTVAIHC